MYAGDILVYKPINYPRNYTSLQAYIDAIQDCQTLNIESTQIQVSHLPIYVPSIGWNNIRARTI